MIIHFCRDSLVTKEIVGVAGDNQFAHGPHREDQVVNRCVLRRFNHHPSIS